MIESFSMFPIFRCLSNLHSLGVAVVCMIEFILNDRVPFTSFLFYSSDSDSILNKLISFLLSSNADSGSLSSA